MNILNRGQSLQFGTHIRDSAQSVENVTASMHFNTIQANLEKKLSEKNGQASRDLDHLQELRMFMNELARYKLKLQEKVRS